MIVMKMLIQITSDATKLICLTSC